MDHWSHRQGELLLELALQLLAWQLLELAWQQVQEKRGHLCRFQQVRLVLDQWVQQYE